MILRRFFYFLCILSVTPSIVKGMDDIDCLVANQRELERELGSFQQAYSQYRADTPRLQQLTSSTWLSRLGHWRNNAEHSLQNFAAPVASFLRTFTPGTSFAVCEPNNLDDGVVTRKFDYTSISDKVSNIRKNLQQTKPPAEEVTVFLGQTAAGKTTVYNHMQEIPLVSIVHGNDFAIERKDKVDGQHKKGDANGDIVHGAGSGTAYAYLSENGQYFDCPGFKDVRGDQQSILNAVTLTTLFNNSQIKKFRIALVVSKDDLAGRGDVFAKLIGQLGELFPNQEEYLKGGLNLIITKIAPEKTDKRALKGIKDKIKNIKNTHGYLSTFQINLMEFLCNDDAHITFFPCPKEEGDVIEVNRDDLIKSNYIGKLDAKITISPETKQFIQQWGESIKDRMESILNQFNNTLNTNAKLIIGTRAKESRKAAKLRDLFEDHATSLKTITMRSGPKTFNSNAANFTNVLTAFKNLSDPNVVLLSTFDKLVKEYECIADLKPEDMSISVPFNPNGILTQSLARLRSLGTPPIPRLLNSGRLEITGNIVGTSDLTSPDTTKLMPGITTMVVHGRHALLIDNDFEGPGIDTVFAAPQWFVIGGRSINLQGATGVKYNHAADNGADTSDKPLGTDGSHGSDGSPGLHGQNGGNFLGIVKNIYGVNDLTINVSGGNGGSGQKGGNGTPGRPGKKGEKSHVQNIGDKESKQIGSPRKLNRTLPMRLLLTPSDANEITLQSGIIAGKGGNAGKGGTGGKGGNPGTVGFYIYDDNNRELFFSEPKIRSIRASQGKEGRAGAGGSPGFGGIYEHVFRGTYIDYPQLPTSDKVAVKVVKFFTEEAYIGALMGGGAVGAIAFGAGAIVMRINPQYGVFLQKITGSNLFNSIAGYAFGGAIIKLCPPYTPTWKEKPYQIKYSDVYPGKSQDTNAPSGEPANKLNDYEIGSPQEKEELEVLISNTQDRWFGFINENESNKQCPHCGNSME